MDVDPRKNHGTYRYWPITSFIYIIYTYTYVSINNLHTCNYRYSMYFCIICTYTYIYRFTPNSMIFRLKCIHIYICTYIYNIYIYNYNNYYNVIYPPGAPRLARGPSARRHPRQRRRRAQRGRGFGGGRGGGSRGGAITWRRWWEMTKIWWFRGNLMGFILWSEVFYTMTLVITILFYIMIYGISLKCV